MLREKMLYSLRDICVIPAVVTDIKSRKECNCRRKSIECVENYFPLIAAPMDSVVTEDNWKIYHENKISCVIPRTVPIKRRLELCKEVFCAFGLKEVDEYFVKDEAAIDACSKYNITYHVLIDIANGQMQEEIQLGETLKFLYGRNIVLMGGNIANPFTYLLYDKAGFDFLRCSVATGAACLTGTQTSIFYPAASLISEISEIKRRYHSHCKIIADGGMSGYSDIIKALALGADYVMCGRIFAQAAKNEEDLGTTVVYRGMSTKEAQKAMGNTELKTAEGKSMFLEQKYTLSGWIENFDSYIRSAMSYCDSRTLDEFREKSICQVISPNSSSQINDK